MSPRFFSPAEDADIDEAADAETERVQEAEREDGMLSVVVIVVETVEDEWYDPNDHVDDRVDEKQAELALDCTPASLLDHGRGISSIA
jgi:hypothetical protein